MPTHVLLIDDDDGFSNSLQEYFTLHGVKLERASSWEEGMAKFRVGLHELVIADYNLPGSRHGLQLLASIKPLRPSSRLILISGAITSVPENRIRISGLVDNYFPKTGRLASSLLELAAEATTRASSPSDWRAIAKAHIAGNELEEVKLEQIDQLLRRDIQGG